MKRFISLFTVLMTCYTLIAQEYKYDVILLGKKIGDMTLSRLDQGDAERYLINSESQAKVLFVKQHSEVKFDVLFKSGILEKSHYSSVKKDDNIVTNVNRNTQGYSINSNNKHSNIKDRISYSSVLLYFKEPVGISKIFVERIGDFLPLKKTAQGVYEYLQPDGTRSIYRYLKGKLAEVELKRGMGSVFIRPN